MMILRVALVLLVLPSLIVPRRVCVVSAAAIVSVPAGVPSPRRGVLPVAPPAAPAVLVLARGGLLVPTAVVPLRTSPGGVISRRIRPRRSRFAPPAAAAAAVGMVPAAIAVAIVASIGAARAPTPRPIVVSFAVAVSVAIVPRIVASIEPSTIAAIAAAGRSPRSRDSQRGTPSVFRVLLANLRLDLRLGAHGVRFLPDDLHRPRRALRRVGANRRQHVAPSTNLRDGRASLPDDTPRRDGVHVKLHHDLVPSKRPSKAVFATLIGRRVALAPRRVAPDNDATPRFPRSRRRRRVAPAAGAAPRDRRRVIAVAAASNLRLGQRAILEIVRDHVRVLDDQQRIVRRVGGVDAVIQRVGEATHRGAHGLIRAGDSHGAIVREGARDQRGIVRGSLVHRDGHGRVGDDGDGVEAGHLRRGDEEASGVIAVGGARAHRPGGGGARERALGHTPPTAKEGVSAPGRGPGSGSVVGVARVGGGDDDAAHRVGGCGAGNVLDVDAAMGLVADVLDVRALVADQVARQADGHRHAEARANILGGRVRVGVSGRGGVRVARVRRRVPVRGGGRIVRGGVLRGGFGVGGRRILRGGIRRRGRGALTFSRRASRHLRRDDRDARRARGSDPSPRDRREEIRLDRPTDARRVSARGALRFLKFANSRAERKTTRRVVLLVSENASPDAPQLARPARWCRARRTP